MRVMAKYENLKRYTTPVKRMKRKLVGRDAEMRSVAAAMERAELSNVILLAAAGSGKTSLVQGLMERDKSRVFFETNLSQMIADAKNPDEIGNMLKCLFDEASRFGEMTRHEVVLFMDEFHQIVQLSAAAVEALKPLLADSATRGIRVIAATTYEEFRKYISDNQPLVERLQRINVPEPDKETTVRILKGMAERYGVADDIVGCALYETIYDVTQRHIPANAQPRKSLLVLDAMVGWHRSEHRKFDNKLLADVIFESEGINIAFSVDPSTIKAELDKRVLAQTYATRVVEERLQLCVAGLNDQSRPQSSFLLCGPSGVGKTELTKQLSRLLFGDSTRSLIRMDCAEYANADSLERFRTELTARVWEHPYSIVLLDEVEKACPEVTRVLLSVLDDARLSDRNGREVSFLNCYFVLTTNAGTEIYRTIAQYESDDKGDGSFLSRYDRLIRRSLTASTGGVKFPPELLGRIDCIVPFQPLSYKTMEDICIMRLRELRQKLLSKYGIDMSVEDRVVTYLVQDSLTNDSDAGGARAVMAKLESEVTTSVARFVNMRPEIRKILVEVEGELVSENKTRISSDACVKIKGIVG